ncbi:hypothetical protein L1887_16690 [Cichorium endivia]|nr:hypothetical protein L1887_16690 [Cichorium endivia]
MEEEGIATPLPGHLGELALSGASMATSFAFVTGMDCSEFGSVAEVLRIKKILDKSADESESESVLCDLLTKLESMGLSVKTLEATRIGKFVSPLKKHASENVRRISVTLVKGKEVGSFKKKPANIVNGGGRDSSEKLEATKRKLGEAYLAAENMKKKPRIQVMELHEVAKQGLLPQMSRCIKPGNNRNRQMGNGRR